MPGKVPNCLVLLEVPIKNKKTQTQWEDWLRTEFRERVLDNKPKACRRAYGFQITLSYLISFRLQNSWVISKTFNTPIFFRWGSPNSERQTLNPGPQTPSRWLFQYFSFMEEWTQLSNTPRLGGFRLRNHGISESPLDMTTQWKEISLLSPCLSPKLTPCLCYQPCPGFQNIELPQSPSWTVSRPELLGP